MADELPAVRRVITGRNGFGRSVFVEDGLATFQASRSGSGMRWLPVWATRGTPVPIDEPDRSAEAGTLTAPPGGSSMKIVDLPPEPQDPEDRAHALAAMRERIKQAGVQPERGAKRYPEAAHPGMHETDTIDYVVVLSGEIYAVVEEGETLLKAGDVLIQRGTNHAWSNRSDGPCRIVVVQVEAKR